MLTVQRCGPLAALVVILAAGSLAGTASAQWPGDPAVNVAVADKTGEQVIPKIVVTADGGCYIGWFDSATGSYQVWLQRLLPDGSEAWPHNGILVSNHAQDTSLVDWDMTTDADGNCVLVFTDIRDGGDLDVFTYKVSQAGTMLWGADGVQLSFNNDYEPAPRVCRTSDNEFVFVWARLPSGGSGSIMMQRLTNAGVPKLAIGGQPVVAQAGEDPAFCSVVPAESGNVIVSWVRDITTFASPRYLRARKFSPTAAPLWPVVTVFDALPLPIAYQPGLVQDGAGGALLWWHRSDNSGLYNSFVQHLDAGGTELFPHNGVAVASTANRNHLEPTLSFDKSSGDIFVFWIEENSLQSQWGLSGQRFTAAGVPQWGTGGRTLQALNTDFKGPPRSEPWYDGAMVFTYDEPTNQFGKDRALGQRIDAAGTLTWGTAPVVISSVPSTKSRLPVAIDDIGDVKLAWEDDRNGTPDVYAQAVRPDGTLGAGLSPWTNLGSTLAGTHGAPLLDHANNPVAGENVGLLFSNMLENTSAYLVIGLSPLNAPFKGGTLVPAVTLLVPGLPTGPSGSFNLFATWPDGIPSGFSLWFQAWITDAAGPAGFAATNALKATTP